MSSVWMQGRSGRPIKLVDPTPDEVDFCEIAETLAQINRYCGSSIKPCSVAQHTLIACEAAPEAARPWVLLHDAHEARTGDLTTPIKAALGAVAESVGGAQARVAVSDALARLALRHDLAIHAAADLPMPTDAQHREIERADLVALMTERRDYLGTSGRPWAVDALNIRPLQKAFRLRPPYVVADELLAMFRRYLPALRGHTTKET